MRNAVDLIARLEGTDPSKGIVLVGANFQESFHPYADLFLRMRALARQFAAQGLAPGQRVLIPLSTEIDAIASFLALIYLGAVPFSVAAPLIGQDREAHRRQMVRLVKLHGVHRLVVSEGLSGIVGAYPETPTGMALTVTSPQAADRAEGTRVTPHEPQPDDVVFVQFSSGSTSHPKGVRITHRGLIYNLSLILESDRRTADSVWMSWLPLYHDMGLVGGLLSNFVLRNPLVLMNPRCFITRPGAWLADVSKHRGYVTAIPNFALDVCMERIRDQQLQEHPLDLSSFRYLYNGSEPVRPSSIRRFEERFGPHGFVAGSVRPVYGMAEATLIISAPKFDEPLIVRNVDGMDVPSVGYPLGDFELEIRDEAGRVLDAERVGEIHIRGTSVTPGYLETAGVPQTEIVDGWLATGDLGLRDRDGRLYVTGRKKDLLIVQGRNFYGHDVAAFIEESWGLRTGTVHVFAVEHDGRERVIAMLARPKGDSEDDAGRHPRWADPARLKAEVQSLALTEFGLPIDDAVAVPRIPKTTSGKIIRQACRQMYLETLG